MEWKTIKYKQIHKRGAEDVYENKPGPRHAPKSVKNLSSLFKLFLTETIMDKIVQYTNKSMQPAIDKFSDPLDGSTEYSHVKLVTRIDIEAFIGILYLRAGFRLNVLDRKVIWNHESTHDIIGAAISLHRIKLICCLITFDHKETRNDRWKTDKFAYMRGIFENINERNARMRHPSPFLSIHETY